MSSFRLQVRNFRALRTLDWSPDGVCLLAGANGAGKSTVLDALLFLRVLFERGHEAALLLIGGRYVRNTFVPETEPVCFDLTVDQVTWRVKFPMTAGGLLDTYGEELFTGTDSQARVGMHEQMWSLGGETLRRDPTRSYARALFDRGDAPWLKPLAEFLLKVSVYTSYQLHRVQRSNPQEPRQNFLHWSGANLWSVLANWKGASIKWEGRYEWVIQAAIKAFPGLLSAIEYEDGFPVLYPIGAPSREYGLPPERAAAGLLTGLLHLTAVAGAKDGALVAFDEIENQLHPHAIRSLMGSIRERAAEHELTILVTTHSPIVMNGFGSEPDRVFVLDQSIDGPQPVRLTDLHDEDALAQTRLGSLYDQLEFAWPAGPRTDASRS